MEKAVLLLDDGTVFWGKSNGMPGTVTGEVCFNTGMTGYQEIFTDPSYTKQIMVTTNVHIGNYGTRNAEDESDGVKIAGLVCRNFMPTHSRKMADQNLQSYCNDRKLVAISDIDTRKLVRHIRQKGAMNGVISSEISDLEELKAILSDQPSMGGLELSSTVTTQVAYTIGHEDAKYRVAVLDFGVKRSILTCMSERGAFLKVFPAHTSLETLLEWNPDAYFLSNGPGDPAAMPYAVCLVQQILELNKPLFGICLGQQLLALAVGIPTYKLHHGHRGLNHPVKNLVNGRCEITSQNHGFGVLESAVYDSPSILSATHINLNDQSVEGIRLTDKPAFSVQYHPEASPGPHDARYLFDDFFALIH